jgi:hypothetical protein
MLVKKNARKEFKRLKKISRLCRQNCHHLGLRRNLKFVALLATSPSKIVEETTVRCGHRK